MHRFLPRLAAAPLLLVFLFVGCSDTTTPPKPGNQNSLIRGEINPGDSGFSLLVESGGDPANPVFGPFEVRGSHIAWNNSLGALSIDLTVTNRGVVAHAEPIGIEFISLLPESVTVMNSDNGVGGPGAQIEFSFANDDGRWTPGETSLPRNVLFGTAPGSPILFVAHILIGTTPPGNTIGGLVWNDVDADGFPDRDEFGLAGWPVVARNVTGPYMPPERLWRTRTGPDGVYRIEGLEAGLYEVASLPADPNFESTTPSTIHVILVGSGGGGATPFTNANFGWHEVAVPPPPPPDSALVMTGDYTEVLGWFTPDRGLIARTVTVARCGYFPVFTASPDTVQPPVAVCPDRVFFVGPITDINEPSRQFAIMNSRILLPNPPPASWDGSYAVNDIVRAEGTVPLGFIGIPMLLDIAHIPDIYEGDSVGAYVTGVVPGRDGIRPEEFFTGGVRVIVTPETVFTKWR